MPGGADPRRAMDVDSDVALLTDDGLAGVDAHADAELGPVRPVMARERLLGRDGGRDGVLRSAEAVEERVSLRVDLLAPTRAESLADDAAVIRERVGVPVAELLEQLGRAGDVGEDERDRAALQRAHALSRSVSSDSARRRRTRGFASLTISSRYTM